MFIEVEIDGCLYKKEINNPAVVFDISNGKMLHIGEYAEMMRISIDVRSKLIQKGRLAAANDLVIHKIESQSELTKIWDTGLVVVKQ